MSIAFWTRIAGNVTLQAGDDASAAHWWPFDNLPPLAFDHADIVRQAKTIINPQKN